MSLKDRKTEGGNGGKLGHSNMSHWDYTEVIKQECKKARRIQDKETCKQEYASLVKQNSTTISE